MYHQLWPTPAWQQEYTIVQLSPHVVKVQTVLPKRQQRHTLPHEKSAEVDT